MEGKEKKIEPNNIEKTAKRSVGDKIKQQRKESVNASSIKKEILTNLESAMEDYRIAVNKGESGGLNSKKYLQESLESYLKEKFALSEETLEGLIPKIIKAYTDKNLDSLEQDFSEIESQRVTESQETKEKSPQESINDFVKEDREYTPEELKNIKKQLQELVQQYSDEMAKDLFGDYKGFSDEGKQFFEIKLEEAKKAIEFEYLNNEHDSNREGLQHIMLSLYKPFEKDIIGEMVKDGKERRGDGAWGHETIHSKNKEGKWEGEKGVMDIFDYLEKKGLIKGVDRSKRVPTYALADKYAEGRKHYMRALKKLEELSSKKKERYDFSGDVSEIADDAEKLANEKFKQNIEALTIEVLNNNASFQEIYRTMLAAYNSIMNEEKDDLLKERENFDDLISQSLVDKSQYDFSDLEGVNPTDIYNEMMDLKTKKKNNQIKAGSEEGIRLMKLENIWHKGKSSYHVKKFLDYKNIEGIKMQDWDAIKEDLKKKAENITSVETDNLGNISKIVCGNEGIMSQAVIDVINKKINEENIEL